MNLGFSIAFVISIGNLSCFQILNSFFYEIQMEGSMSKNGICSHKKHVIHGAYHPYDEKIKS